MNAYFENFENTRYNDNIRTHAIPEGRFGDGLISFICALVGMFTCPAAVMIEKTAVIFALLLAFFGVVGGIESGAVSMLLGIVICATISGAEYAVLKSMFKKSKKSGH